MGCIGHHQRQVRRCFIAANGEAVRTADLMRWCYPSLSKFSRWHWWSVSRAAHRFGVNVRRGFWAPSEELRRRIGR